MWNSWCDHSIFIGIAEYLFAALYEIENCIEKFITNCFLSENHGAGIVGLWTLEKL